MEIVIIAVVLAFAAWFVFVRVKKTSEIIPDQKQSEEQAASPIVNTPEAEKSIPIIETVVAEPEPVAPVAEIKPKRKSSKKKAESSTPKAPRAKKST